MEESKEKVRKLAEREAGLNQEIETAREKFLQAKFKKEHLEEQRTENRSKLKEKGYDIETAADILAKQLKEAIEKCNTVYNSAPIEKIAKWAKEDATLQDMIKNWDRIDSQNEDNLDINGLYKVLSAKSEIVKCVLAAAQSLYDKAAAKEDAYLNQRKEIEEKLKAEGIDNVENLEEHIEKKAAEYEQIIDRVEYQMTELKKVKMD